MVTQDTILHLVQNWGILILAPIATVEGPAVTILAGYLARLGLLDPLSVYVCVVVADLAGDVVFYQLGRHGHTFFRSAWLLRLGVTRVQLARLIVRFRRRGMRFLIFGKITHYLGFATLLAAGASRMPFGRFFTAIFVATLPKSLVLVGIGWVFGDAWMRDGPSFYLALALILGLGLLGAALFLRRKSQVRP